MDHQPRGIRLVDEQIGATMTCDICGNSTPVVRRWRNAWLCQCCYRKAMEFERRRDNQ